MSQRPVLIPVLGDQLSHGLASLQGADQANATVLLAEVWDEATYVRHHQAKIALVFSAMRHFAEELRADGWTVDYVKLDDPANTGSLRGEVERALARHDSRAIRVVEPGEWRLQQDFKQWSAALGCPVEILPDTRFLCSKTEFYTWAAARRELRMEYFYRDMRRQTGLLMDGDKPTGGKWNFDAENRSSPPANLTVPRYRTLRPIRLRGRFWRWSRPGSVTTLARSRDLRWPSPAPMPKKRSPISCKTACPLLAYIRMR